MIDLAHAAASEQPEHAIAVVEDRAWTEAAVIIEPEEVSQPESEAVS